MAGRIRTIKPEILEDETVSGLTDGAWRLWVSLWTLADDHGNCRCSPKWFAGQIWWAKGRDLIEVEGFVCELFETKRIDIYQVRGERYLHINNWDKHQRIDNAGKPRVPLQDEGTPACAIFRGDSPRVSANLRLTTTPTNDPDLDPDLPDSVESAGVDQTALVLVPLEPSPPRFDFEGIYQAHWIRKEGKTDGMKICEGQIKTEADFQQWTKAVKNYSALMRSEGRELKRQKHFSSFMGRWKDYVDIAPSSGGVMDAASSEKGRSLF